MFVDRWHAFGNLIGSKMPFIVPCCVAAGVLFPQVFSPIRAVVPVMFAFMTFQGSLNNTVHQLVGVFKHPKDLIVILLISQAFMPTLAYFLGNLLFAGNVNLVTGILLEYSVPVAVVSFMWVGMFHGDGPLGLAVILVSTVLAPFSIPFTLQILMGHSIQIDAAKMIFDMVLMIALPALAGMMVNELTHEWGARTSLPRYLPRLSHVAGDHHYSEFDRDVLLRAPYDLGAHRRGALHFFLRLQRVHLGPVGRTPSASAATDTCHHELRLWPAQYLVRRGHRQPVFSRRSGVPCHVRHPVPADARCIFWRAHSSSIR